MVQDTSYEAYEKLIACGGVSKKRGEVLLYVAKYPGCTAWDCEEHYKPRNKSSINARFSELVDRGLIKEVGRKIQYGNSRLTYTVTGRLDPIKVNKNWSWKQRYEILLKACLEVVDSSGINEWDKQVVRNALIKIGYLPK